MLGAILLVVVGHAITIPTALAVAEIATNLKVEGGGEYYIISRSFGTTVGGAIGISLYLSQAVSVAFYLIAFAEAFRPLFPLIEANLGFTPDPRMISIPAALVLVVLIIYRGANIGIGLLWIVVAILAVSIGMFFLGGPTSTEPMKVSLFDKIEDPKTPFYVFAIIFPAFTGMTAGVGLSGDLKNPRKSIPLGTMSATITGMIVYILIVIKMAYSASPEDLAGDQFVMSRIAIWGPIIPIGLAAATVSSAIGSILVAPRTLQALATDRIMPVPGWNRYLMRGKPQTNEPINATLLTSLIVLVFVGLGDVDFVAKIISVFFMITYGTLCTISFLEHFAGNPSYRPTFRTKWYLSLIGALAAFIMMFQMSTVYAIIAVSAQVGIYLWIKSRHKGERDLAAVIKGVLFQMTRQLQVMIQKKQAELDMTNWRPSFVAVSKNALSRLAPFDLLRWISHHYGFGTYIHYIEGSLNRKNTWESETILDRMIEQTQDSDADVYVNTIISPSFKTAVAQLVQMPGVAGMDNNSILFEFHSNKPEEITDILDGCQFAAAAGFNICVLRSSEHHFGYNRKIHIWLTPGDYRNANLMIILAYIIIGHPDWRNGDVTLFATFRQEEKDYEVKKLNDLISRGKIPISINSVRRLHLPEGENFSDFVADRSESADLVITGFSLKKIIKEEGAFFKEFFKIKDILFVRAGQDILIAEEDAAGADADVENQKE